MSEAIIVALIVGIPAMITSVTSMIITIKNAFAIKLIEKNTNSMKDALVAAALIQGEHTGKEKEIEKQKEIIDGIKTLADANAKGKDIKKEE